MRWTSGCRKQNRKDHVYRLIELTGTSITSIGDAVDMAIKRAHKTLKNLNLCQFQAGETHGDINKGKTDHRQVADVRTSWR